MSVYAILVTESPYFRTCVLLTIRVLGSRGRHEIILIVKMKYHLNLTIIRHITFPYMLLTLCFYPGIAELILLQTMLVSSLFWGVSVM